MSKKFFNVGAGGYNAVGVVMCFADSALEAQLLANGETDLTFDLTYYAHNAVEVEGVTVNDNETESRVTYRREYGHPGLPSRDVYKRVLELANKED